MSLLRTDKEIEEIYNRNADSVYRMAYLYFKNNADAEDIMQNVFIRFIDSSVVFSDKNHERAWFLTVTKNLSKDLLKSVWRSRQKDIEGIGDIAYTDTYKMESDILKEIKKMKTNYRIALYLYYYEEYSVREIAEVMQRKESTVQTWLSSGREKLRRQIGGVTDEKSI